MAIPLDDKSYRYSAGFVATEIVEQYDVIPVTGRPEQSYFALINTGLNNLLIAFGNDVVAPLEAAFWVIPQRGSFEPLAGFHARGVSHMFIKGLYFIHA